ncbi:peptide deformylase [Candidatus Woesebacteria bacterium]|nr:peptide deformylase [Candidatus Woesebacteria bacterium]
MDTAVHIITIPHPTLRQKALPVTRVDKKLLSFVSKLGSTLQNSNNPRGVGLAANQVNRKIAVFSTLVPLDSRQPAQLRMFINPKIVDQSDEIILGLKPGDKKPFDEGCLSMPKIYGAVPRAAWIKLSFDTIVENELVTQTEVFEHFPARVIQHEFDHLQGILFTDHSLKHNLPVFKEVTPEKWEEIDPQLLTLF